MLAHRRQGARLGFFARGLGWGGRGCRVWGQGGSGILSRRAWGGHSGSLRGSLALLVAVGLAASANAQSISLDTVPPYGSLGFITGTVTGADPNTHHVATYLQIEGFGWWTKPTTASPTVPIGAGGGFSANVGTGGSASLDSRATIFCALLFSDATAPSPALGAGRIPAAPVPIASDCVERYGRTIEFAGYTWAVKESPLAVGPGQNRFSDRAEDVYVDAEGLHLWVDFHDGVWWSTEVILLETLGHGTYVIQTDSELDDLDPQITFGIFPWDAYGDETTVPGSPNREFDFEDSRWANAADPTNAQMVVQPYTAPGNLVRYTLPDLSGNAELTRIFRWLPGSIEFVALTGHHLPKQYPPTAVIAEYVYLHDPPSQHVPTPGRERLHLNAWLNNVELGGAGPPQPAGGQPVEIVITDVIYVPEPGAGLLWAAGLTGLGLLARIRRRS